MRRLRAFAAAAITTALALPALAAAPALAAEPAAATAAECTVTGGELTWGFKESFRSYISGTIANGSWTPIAPAAYATPVFTWPADGGTVDAATGAGEVSFAGGVQFTGHGGLLDTTIANPTLVLAADGTAQVLLDISGLSMEDALAGDTDAVHTAEQVPFVALDLASVPLTVGEQEVSATAVPAAVTEEGFAEFGSYPAGTAFDPVTFTVALDCAAAEAATPLATDQPLWDDKMTVDPVATLWMWLAPVLIAAVVLVAIMVIVLVVLSRRRGGSGGPRERGDGR